MSSHNQWSQFWSQGFITTFGASLSNNYTGSVKAFWTQLFSSLDTSASILDVATGNGAVATMAAACGQLQGKHFSVHATDKADINPKIKALNDQDIEYRRTVTFHANTPCEQLPFQDASFDIVSSQFGIEYSNLSISIPEVSRVLKTHGSFLALIHFSESPLVKQAIKELVVYQQALDKTDLFDVNTQYFSLMQTPKNINSLVIKQQAKKLNQTMNSFIERYRTEQPAQEIFNAIVQLTKKHAKSSLKKKLSAFEACRQNYSLARQRLTDMADASLNSDDVTELKTKATATGFTSVNIEPFFSDNGQQMAWKCILKK
jgi:ubiquinone/menaquinone biosynthesis C-methylase UbiE